MKQLFTFLLVVCSIAALPAANLDSLQQQIDSAHYALFRPYISDYVKQADELAARIHAAPTRDSVRYYSKNLYKLTESTIEIADKIYGYKTESGTTIGTGYAAGCGYTTVIMPYSTTFGARPAVVDQLLKIDDKSDNLRWFPSRKESQLQKIREALTALRKY